ncbi:MAG TPA: autotransporter-associated beta strand repeat-containing protein [Verrucomicrobiae bacterium]|nr:autotransporter-associated beta strand repeat-containing protein [Verrucomicrobiae bacterium]
MKRYTPPVAACCLMLAVLASSQTRAAENTWDNSSGNFLWDLSSANWTAPTVWSDGDDAIFGTTGAGTVTLGDSITVENQTFNAPGYTIVGDGNIMTVAGTTPTITVNADSTSAASIYGTDGLTIQGTGALSLQGDAPNLDANHYTGGTYVRGGTVLLGARGANADGSSYAVDSIEVLDAGATVKFDTLFDGTTYSSPAPNQIATHSTAFSSHLHMTGGTFDLNNEPRVQHIPIPDGTGLIVNNGAAVQSGLIMVVDGHDHEFSGVIADGGPLVGDNSGQGPGRQIGIVSFAATISTNGSVWTLSGPNTYSGSTRLQFGGSIKLVGNGTIGFPTSNGLTGPLRIYGPSYLDLNGHNQTIALMTSGDAGGKIFNSAVGTVSTLTFGYGNESVTSRNANMQYIDNPGTGGVLAMTKIGTNCIQTLSGTNTYSGDTTVSEGTLAFAAASAVSPNSAFRLNTNPNNHSDLKLTYAGTANVRQLWIDGVQQPNGVYGAGTPGIDPASTGTITVTGATVLLGFSQTGNAIMLTWQGNYKLQSKTNNIVGSWFDYPGGGTSPVNVTIDPAQSSVFFRLSSP